MSTSIVATSAVFDQLDSSLDELEEALAPLLERPLQDTLTSLPGPVERAKVLFWVAYTIHSCSWSQSDYLRSRFEFQSLTM